jgi:hypothetical protein
MGVVLGMLGRRDCWSYCWEEGVEGRDLTLAHVHTRILCLYTAFEIRMQ